jgi:superfamily II DNA or RNA helicase
MSSQKDAKSYIGKRGYIIRKKILTDLQIKNIKDELTVRPFCNGDYGKDSETFKVYLENDGKLYLPKFYGLEKFGKPDINTLPNGANIDIDFSLNLKEEQKMPAQYTLNAYKEKGGGILSLPCGFGKTILALYFISQLKKKTIVIVHKEFLMNQWIERIQFALPNAKVGIVQADKCEIAGNDIIIGMLQTISMKEFPPDTFNEIGHVIIDECHRIPSRVFSKALLKINSNYMLGLSATPNRKDGLTKVLKWYIGDIIYSVKSSEKNVVLVERYILTSTDENYNKELVNFRKQVQMPSMINNITNYYKRTKLIMNQVCKEILGNPARQILILSDRKQHLEDMFKMAQESGINSVGYYVGGMKKEKLKENESCKLLLGTFPMANEGLDIPSLNGLVLATPKSDIIQSVGRICRVKHDNIQPIIIDIVDTFSIFDGQSKKRLTVYKKKKYQVKDVTYDLDNSKVRMTKEYAYHKCGDKKGSDDDDSIDDNSIDDNFIYEVDTEYDNIDCNTNLKIKSNDKIKNDKKTNQKNSNAKIREINDKEFNDIFASFIVK